MITIQQTTVVAIDLAEHRLTHINCDASVIEASKLMRKSGADELLVTSETDGALMPLGIVTASDIVTRVIAAELDPAVMTTGDIAWSGATSADGSATMVQRLCHGRDAVDEALAVLDGNGVLVGTVRLHEIVGAVPRPPAKAAERHDSPVEWPPI